MKISKMAMAVAIAGLLTGSQAFAQQRTAYGLRQPVSARPTAYEYNSYYAEDDAKAKEAAPSPSDEPAPAAAPADAAAAPAAAPSSGGCATCGGGSEGCSSCGGGCDSGCGCGSSLLFGDCCLGEPWRAFDDECLKCNDITITGWVTQSFAWNPDDPADRSNGPVTFKDRSNDYLMNQAYVYAERKANTNGCGWDLGGRIDVLWGSDARFTKALGLDDDWTSSRFYGGALPQAYAEVAYNDLSVKLGHFYTILGYEVVPDTANFFPTHSYTMQYGEPFTHTGALASYAATDNVTVSAGITRGWDTWEDNNDNDSFLGGITWTSCDKCTSIAYAMTIGDEPVLVPIFRGRLAVTNNANRFAQSLVVTRKLYENLTYVFQSDYGIQKQGEFAGIGLGGLQFRDAEWYGINQYLLYQVSDCVGWGLRGEWFRDDDGTRVAALDGGNTASAGGFAGNFYEISLGLNYKPNANVIIRPEARYDWFDGDALNGVRPYDDGSSNNQFLLTTDVIVTF